ASYAPRAPPPEKTSARRGRGASGSGSMRLASANPLDVHVGARVDPDALAFLHEERDLHHGAGFELRGLGGARGGIALQAGIALRHRRNDEWRKLDVDRLAAPEHHVDLEVLLEILPRVADLRLGERELIVGLLVHEDVLLTVLVEVLHLLVLDLGFVEALTGAERALEHPARAQVLDLRAH